MKKILALIIAFTVISVGFAGYADEPMFAVTNGGATFEFEDVFPKLAGQAELKDSEFASKGQFVYSSWVNASYSGTYTVDFSVDKSGQYSVHFITAFVMENFSSVTFKIDDTLIAENGNYSSEPHTDTKINSTSPQSGNKYLQDFSKSMNLDEGVHTMTLTVSGASIAGGRNAYAFDSISIYQPKEYTDISVESPDFVKCGDEIPLSVLDQDGVKAEARNYESLEYSTDTQELIDIRNGKIYARNCGVGRISIKMTTSKAELNRDISVSIVPSNGLEIKSVERNGQTVSVNIYAADDYTGGTSLFLVGYDVINGIKCLIAGSKTAKVESLSQGQECQVDFDLSDWDEFKQLNLFMYNGNTGASFGALAFVKDIN